MSIYSKVESGTSGFKSRFTKSISFTKRYNCRFGELVPVCAKFVLPGDVWRIGGDVLVRFQPMVSPSLTTCNFKVRYFFVPLRLLEKNCDLIITGSQNGHLFTGELPTFNDFLYNADTTEDSDAKKVKKYSFYDYLGCQVADYTGLEGQAFLPAEYWSKANARVFYDYFDDENIGEIHSDYDDFDDYWDDQKKHGANQPLYFAKLPKDYFTSSLPWQLKGVAPTLNVSGTGTVAFDWDSAFDTETTAAGYSPVGVGGNGSGSDVVVAGTLVNNQVTAITTRTEQLKNAFSSVTGTLSSFAAGFNADELRTMMAQTRIFERLARCGSRYVEYLRANFGIAPADETLQRSQYLGGWKIPIMTTEVLQTAADGTSPVGNMRGHGITRGGNKINTFVAKEFGILLGLAHIMPSVEYTTGCPREFSYKSRFDFFNPSFQHLSEQEVRNGELYVGSTKNDDTFGFQAYANELRSSVDMTVADLRDTLSYWTQSVNFSSRPNLNDDFISSDSYLSNFNQCFAVSCSDARPCIVQFRNNFDVYRPMVRYSTPGLVDHL